MPSLDLPENLQKADKIQVHSVKYMRIPDDSCPKVHIVICSGYYPLNADGTNVLNALGFDRFIKVEILKEFTLPMNDPLVQAMLNPAGEMNLQYRQYIIDHPEIPLFAVYDDFQTRLALELYDKYYLNPVQIPAALPVDPVVPVITPVDAPDPLLT